MWCLAAAVLAPLALLVDAAGAGSSAGFAGSGLQQDCFCSEIWACVSRKGFPYSECDQEGRKVICCVRRDAVPLPLPLPLPRPQPLPRPRTAATPSPELVTTTEAQHHFRFSTGSQRSDGDSSRRGGGFVPTTDTATPLFETTRLPPTTTTPGRIVGFSSSAPSRIPGFATPAPGRIPGFPTSPTVRIAGFTTPSSVVGDTTRFSPLDGFDVVHDRFSSTSASSGELSRYSTTPSASPESFRSSTERASTRYQENAVTPKPTAPQGSHRRPHQHKYEEDYDDGVQEIGWDDGEPHVTWSGEDFQPLRQPRIRQHPKQQRQQHQQTQEQQQHQQQQHQHHQQTEEQQQHQQQRDPKKLEWEQIAASWSSWQDCGYKGTDSGLDGTAEPSEWPWHAALLEAASDRYVCGAALVGPTWLLTAAHCVMDYSQDPSSLKVRVGELDVRSDTESFTQERGVVDVVSHPAFDLPTLRHDVALVRIARAPRDHRNVASVCLPANRLDADLDLADEEFPREGTTCIVTGWGRKDEESPHSEVLKEIRVPVWSRGTCQDALRKHLGDSFQLPSTAVCAGAKGRDACDGDGGGPLVCQVQPGGRWMQVGIVSYGIGCGRNGSPGVYTRVSRYASWIRSVAGNLRAFEGAPFPSPSPLPAPAREVPLQAAPVVSRVRVNHYRASTTSRPPSRSVVVLRDSEESISQDEDGAAIGESDRPREFPGTTPPSSEEETGTTDQPRATTPAPRRTSIAANLIAGSDRVGRVVHHHHSNHRNALEAAPEKRNTTTGPSKATFPFSAGTSFIRTSFGTSEWSYPLEAQSSASRNKTKTPVRVGMPGKWYSPSYTGSYRGDAAGSRVPGQILSNVAGKTGAGMNRWYSPYYTGSYRGGYNVNVREVASTAGKQHAPDQAEQASPRPRAFNNVRPPLAQNRWYDGDSRWYTTYHNGSYRTGYMSKPHRFGNAEGTSKPPVVGAATSKQEYAKGKDEAADLSWTYLVQTGAQGAVITLDRAKNATNGTTGDQGSASSWAYPVVSLDEARAGRTLVNISNTFTYPSAPKAGARNSSSNANQHHSNNLSSSYSIYRIYPSVYNPEYSARRRAGKAISVSAGDTKPTGTSSTTKISARDPAGGEEVREMRDMAGSVVGYSHFSSGDTAVSFNITRDMANRTGEDISTARTTTADSTTGGEGMDVPPVQEHGAVTTEGSSDMTSTPGDFSTTSDSNPSTTASVLESVATSGLDSTSTTDPNYVESTTPVGREPERVTHVHYQDHGKEAQLQVDNGLRVSALARRGGRTDSRRLNATEEEAVFAPRRRRPETDPDTAWGDRTGFVRPNASLRSRAMTTTEAASLPMEEAPPMRQRSRQWSRAQQWPAGDNAVTPRKPVSFHPGVRESKVVRTGVSSPESEVEEPVVVISPEGFEQPSGRGGNRARGRRPTATPETEAMSPRTKNRNRQSEFRRRGTSGAGTLPYPALPAQPPAPTSEAPAPAPAADAIPQHNPEPSYTTPAPRSRNFGSKKASRKLKKIVFTSAEEQQAVQETVYQSGHKQQQQQHDWAPAAVLPSISAEGAAADVGVIGERPEHTAVEDLEREDVYTFISQRAKRRRFNANKVASDAQEVPAPQVPQVPSGSRWGRSRRPQTPPQ